MRTIKFRAWDKDTKKMWQVESMFIEDEYCTLYKKSIYNETATIKNSRLNIMQFTGLLDKNGKEIYEGDIVKPTPPSLKFGNREIQFIDGSFCYNERHPKKGNNGFWILNKSKAKLFEVIGNIYENSDLIKE